MRRRFVRHTSTPRRPSMRVTYPRHSLTRPIRSCSTVQGRGVRARTAHGSKCVNTRVEVRRSIDFSVRFCVAFKAPAVVRGWDSAVSVAHNDDVQNNRTAKSRYDSRQPLRAVSLDTRGRHSKPVARGSNRRLHADEMEIEFFAPCEKTIIVREETALRRLAGFAVF